MSAISNAQGAVGYASLCIGTICELPALYVCYKAGSNTPVDTTTGIIVTGVATFGIALNIVGITLLALRPNRNPESIPLNQRHIVYSSEENSLCDCFREIINDSMRRW